MSSSVDNFQQPVLLLVWWKLLSSLRSDQAIEDNYLQACIYLNYYPTSLKEQNINKQMEYKYSTIF